MITINTKNKIINTLIFLFGISLLFFNFYPRISTITLRAYFVMGILVVGIFKNQHTKNYSHIIIPVVLVAFVYYIYRYDQIVEDAGVLNQWDILVGTIIMSLTLFVGGLFSPNLLILVGVFGLFLVLGPYLPYSFAHSGFSLSRIINHSIWSDQGLFGMPVGVATSYIFVFILFGEFLKISGLSKFISDISMAYVGHRPGGPAKVAVIASSLMGMINGSAVANVATTGAITIPLMVDTGYDKDFAAGVEAASSTGGQFAPPIMGAIGFLMAEYLGIPYSTVMMAAIMPAFLYFLGILFAVDFRAKKLNLKGVDKKHLPSAVAILKEKGFLTFPIIIVVGLIVLGFSPIYSAIVGIVGVIVVSFLSKESISLLDVYYGVINSIYGIIPIAVATMLIGLVVAVVSLTSFGLNFGNLFMGLSIFKNVLIAGVMVMIMSTILGMGVPGVAAYIIISNVSIPVLIKLGVVPIVAHMFCIMYACLSNITPPVAISSYVAAGIARSDETRTSIQAMKLGLIGFIIPFFFLINPQLLIGVIDDVTIMERFFITASSIFGVYTLTAGLEGILVNRLDNISRILLISVGLLSIYPGVVTDIVGLVIFLGVLVANRRII